MLDVWNEKNSELVLDRLAAVLSADIIFIDPTITTRGLIEFEANVRGFRAKYPHAVISRTSGVDAHSNMHRYTWQISVRGKAVLTGLDVSEKNAEGKICKVLGFFGPLPPLQSNESERLAVFCAR
jgi:hypothetical protein